VEAIEKAGIKTLFGDAAFTSPNNLQVKLPNGTLVDVGAKGFLICAGAGPSRGSIRGLGDHWTYRDALTMSGEAPESLIIAGAGPVGCELAQAFAQMGTNVTLVGPRVLPREAIDASGSTLDPRP
jgi:pyruvate/2-oxoglutarate dehydrogenase complex dihydrolipoamide dehydrogenase (E3) component